MSNDLVTRLREGAVSTQQNEDASREAADELERLEGRLTRYQEALERIRDQTFEQANSPRLIDQLWHFVRWTKSVARAALEATAYQTREVLEAMERDSGIAIKELRADGGMVANEFLMQFQSDILDVPVVRPKIAETTALGAAYVAGLAGGYWSGAQELRRNWAEDKRWVSGMEEKERSELYASWQKAVTRSFDWISAG